MNIDGLDRFFLLGILFLVIFSSGVFSQSLAISPPSIDFGPLIRGGYAEETIRISTREEIPKEISIELSDESNLTWFRIEPEQDSYTVSRDNPLELNFILEPPVDQPNGFYESQINFRVSPESEDELSGETISRLSYSISGLLSAEISDLEIDDCSIHSLSFDESLSIDDQTFSFSLDFRNTGNVFIEPTVELTFKDSIDESIELRREIDFDTINPTISETLSEEFNTNLDEGQFLLEISVPHCDFSRSSLINIIGEGELISSGRVSNVKIEPQRTIVNNPIEIIASYVNDGQRQNTVFVRFAIYRDGQVVDFIDTEEVNVDKGERYDFSTIFTPQDEAQYEVITRGYYDRSITYDVSSSFKAFSEDRIDELRDYQDQTGEEIGGIEDDKLSFSTIFIVLIFSLSILFLVMIIKKKKKTF